MGQMEIGPENQVQIMLVEDQTVVRQGLRRLLETQPEFRIIGEESTVAGAIATALKSDLDLALMDIKLPDGSGLDAAKAILAAKPETRILALSIYDDFPLVEKAMVLGISGYIPKYASFDEIVNAIKIVMKGDNYLYPKTTTRLMEGMRNRNKKEKLHGFTPEEISILQLLADGFKYHEVAAQLYISERTVRRRASHVFTKLGVVGCTQAVAEAIRQGIIE